MNELKHYGVLGMKWGVRRRDRSPGSSDQKTLNLIKKAGIKKSPDVDLMFAIKRMSLMKEYRKAKFPKGKRAKDLSNEELKEVIKKATLYKTLLKRDHQLLSFKKLSAINKMSLKEVESALKRAYLEEKYSSLRAEELAPVKMLVDLVLFGTVS